MNVLVELSMLKLMGFLFALWSEHQVASDQAVLTFERLHRQQISLHLEFLSEVTLSSGREVCY